jgi:hypothetical protein
LPRSKLAAFTATFPSTWSLASISHHLRGTSLALAENVFIARKRAQKLRERQRPVNLSWLIYIDNCFFLAQIIARQKHLLAAETAALQL